MATITISGATFLASQIICSALKTVKGKINKNLKGKIIDVMIFNELSECCAINYAKNSTLKPCNNKNCVIRNIQNVIKYIDEAKYSIDFAMYTLTLSTAMHAIIRAHERGVRIRIITDNEMLGSSGGKMIKLKNFTVDIRVPPVEAFLMHHKFMIIDGHNAVNEIFCQKNEGNQKMVPYRSVVINGSANWTMQGFAGNWENCIVSADDVWTAKLETEFERMWNVFKSIF